jgi:uncharacterized membrane protein YphA (DoxX/SURF4 family)
MDTQRVIDLLLRGGVAFAFLYPPINAIWNPYSWLGYFPSWAFGYLPDQVLLHSFGLVEMIIAIWILSGWRIFWPSLAAAAMLLAIVIVDLHSFEVLFRDVSIAAAALALAIMHYKPRTISPQIP